MYYLCSKIMYCMKKIIFTLIAIVAFCITAQAAGPFKFGVTAGMNITKGEVSSDEANWNGWSKDSESGWFAGFQFKATIPVVGLGLDASLVYSRENVKIEEGETEHLDYLAVPLHLRYDLELPAISYAFVPFIFTGPQAGIAMTKLDKTYRTLDEHFETNITNKDLVWRYDLGFGVILLNHLQAAYSYSFPLSNTYEGKFKDKTSQFESDYKQGVHRISLTYFF